MFIIVVIIHKALMFRTTALSSSSQMKMDTFCFLEIDPNSVLRNYGSKN